MQSRDLHPSACLIWHWSFPFRNDYNSALNERDETWTDPGSAEVMQPCLPLSPCELQHVSTWTMSAWSQWIQRVPAPPQLQLPEPSDPVSQTPLHHVWGWTTKDPCLYLQLWPSDCPLRGHYTSPADSAALSSAFWAEAFSRCEDEWALKFSVNARSPAASRTTLQKGIGCICSPMLWLRYLQWDFILRENDGVVLSDFDGYIMCHSKTDIISISRS